MSFSDFKGWRVQIQTLNRVLNLYNSDTKPIVRTIKKIFKERSMLLSLDEAYNIAMCVKRTAKIPGDIAEVGVYKGGSAKLIAQFKGDKPLHLFDTFEGLPQIRDIDEKNFYTGQFEAGYEDVKRYLEGVSNLKIYKGLFPDTATPVKDDRFSFVHLDVDIYESNKACLEFFYPRMNPGGIILSHDYINSPGVRTSFDEFFANKPEPIIELFRPRHFVERSGSQCLIVKVG